MGIKREKILEQLATTRRPQSKIDVSVQETEEKQEGLKFESTEKKLKSDQRIAKKAGVSTGTVHKVKTILKEGSEELKEKAEIKHNPFSEFTLILPFQMAG